MFQNLEFEEKISTLKKKEEKSTPKVEKLQKELLMKNKEISLLQERNMELQRQNHCFQTEMQEYRDIIDVSA